MPMRFLCLLLLVPMVGAVPIHTDPVGDVELRVAETQSLADGTGHFAHVDLVALDLDEGPLDITFHLSLADLEREGAAFIDDSRLWIVFQHGADYGVQIVRSIDGAGPATYGATLHTLRDGVPGHPTRLHPMVVDDTVSVTVPKQAIPDRSTPPRPGSALEDIRVLSFGFSTMYVANGDDVHGDDDVAGFRSMDAMPEGEGASYAFQIGPMQEGALMLRSSDPVRVSNGGAGVYIFEVHAENRAETHAANLRAVDVPEGWDVRLPFDSVVLEEGASRAFPVMVTVPSGHQHGGLEQFDVVLESSHGVGRERLGLQYTTIPQPAGHHDVVHLHTFERPPFAFSPAFQVVNGRDVRLSLYMNTLAEDGIDAGKAVGGEGVMLPGRPSSVEWTVPLSPELAMGLHLDGSGEFEIPLEYDYVGQDITVRGELRVLGANERTVATLLGSAPDVTRGTTTLGGTIDTVGDNQRVPYRPGQQLVLHLTVEGEFIGGSTFTPEPVPRIAPGGWLRLPLLEYQDAPDPASELADLAIVLDDTHRLANPGSILLVEGVVGNRMATDADLDLRLDGPGAAWASLESGSIRVAAGDELPLRVLVEVPDAASVGESLEIVLIASDADDPFRVAFGRLNIDVVADPVEDDAEALDAWQAEKQSPGPGLPLAVALLAAVALRRRSPQA